MKARKLLATLLALAMTLSMLSVGALAAETEDEKNGVMPISETGDTAPVSNLPADAAASWAADSIERWTATGIVKGDGAGNFNPDAQLTRGELAQIFVNMFGLTVKAENTFGDLKGDEWYADAILKCVAAGIMKGDGVNVNAEAKISRGETIVMFGRAVGVTPDENPDLSKFTDADSVADWAAGYLAPLTKMGILSGSGDGTINAVGNIDRASVMSLLDKAVITYINAPGEYTLDNPNAFVIVNVAAKEGEVIISGVAAGVTVSAGTAEGKIVAKDLKADTIKVDGAAALNVEGKSSVGEVVANATGTVTIAKGVTVDTVTANSTGTVANAGTVNSIVANDAATVSNTGTVKELVANAPAKVDNQGTITKAEVKADGVILDGKKPTEVKVDEGTKNPTDSKGNDVTTGGSTGSGGGYTPPTTESVSGIVGAPLVDATVGDKIPDSDMPIVTATAEKTIATGVITIKFTSDKSIPNHKAGGAGMGYWVGVGFQAPSTATQQKMKASFSPLASDLAASAVTDAFDSNFVKDGITYYTTYFGMAAGKTTAYLAISWDGTTLTKYVLDFSAIKTSEGVDKVNAAGSNKETMQTALEENAVQLGISGNSDYTAMSESRKPSVAQYVIDSKPDAGNYTTAAEIKAAFENGVKYEAAKWALSVKIMNNNSAAADYATLKAAYDVHAAYRLSINKSVVAEPNYVAAMAAFAAVTPNIVAVIHTQFADTDNNAAAGALTNPYRLNDVFTFINAQPSSTKTLTEALATPNIKYVVLTQETTTVASGTTVQIGAGQTVSVPDGKVLAVNGTLNNLGTVNCAGRLNYAGTIAGEGGIIKIATTGSMWTGTQTPLELASGTDEAMLKIVSGTLNFCGIDGGKLKIQVPTDAAITLLSSSAIAAGDEMVIDEGGTLTIAANQTLVVAGKLIVNGTLVNNGLINGNGTVVLSSDPGNHIGTAITNAKFFAVTDEESHAEINKWTGANDENWDEGSTPDTLPWVAVTYSRNTAAAFVKIQLFAGDATEGAPLLSYELTNKPVNEKAYITMNAAENEGLASGDYIVGLCITDSNGLTTVMYHPVTIPVVPAP